MGKLAISVSELAERLNIGRAAAYSLVRRDDFPKIIIGQKKIIIPIEALQAWLNNSAEKKGGKSQ